MRTTTKLTAIFIIVLLSNCKQEQKSSLNLKEQEAIKNLEKHTQSNLDSLKKLTTISIDKHFDIITRYPTSRRFGVKSLNSGIDIMSKTEVNSYVNGLATNKISEDYILNSVAIQTNSSFAIKKVLEEVNPDISHLKLLVIEQQKSHSQNYPVIIKALKVIKNSDQAFVNTYINALKNDEVINQWMVIAYKSLEKGKRNIEKIPQETRLLAAQNLEMADLHLKKLEKFRELIFDLDNSVE
jgi:hypothetical protein